MIRLFLSFFSGLVALLVSISILNCTDITVSSSKNTGRLSLNLNDCLKIAKENNKFFTTADYEIKIAEARKKQALSGYWPSVGLNAHATTMDQDPIFIQPGFKMDIPQLPPPLNFGSISIPVPEQRIKLMDKNNAQGSITMKYPLYTGGYIGSLVKQAESGVEISLYEKKKTELKIVLDIKNYFYATILTNELYKLGVEALERLEATLELTESLYMNGSGRVKKTDYLKNKMIVETVRSIVNGIKLNNTFAKAALVNAIGLDWNTDIEIIETEIPFEPITENLNDYILSSYKTNPTYSMITIGLKALDAKIEESYSGYLPKIALFGQFNHQFNSYEYGYASPENKTNYVVGLGLEYKIFDGFLTTARIEEAKAELNKLESEKILLEKGLATQVQYYFNKLLSLQEQVKNSKNAMNTATENRDLTERAYQDDLMEVQDLIQSQIMESIMKAQYLKSLYDYIEAKNQMEFIIGG